MEQLVDKIKRAIYKGPLKKKIHQAGKGKCEKIGTPERSGRARNKRLKEEKGKKLDSTEGRSTLHQS